MIVAGLRRSPRAAAVGCDLMSATQVDIDDRELPGPDNLSWVPSRPFPSLSVDVTVGSSLSSLPGRRGADDEGASPAGCSTCRRLAARSRRARAFLRGLRHPRPARGRLACLCARGLAALPAPTVAKPVSVLPEPVGAQTSVCPPETIAGQPQAWASVGPSGTRRSNRTRTAGWKRSRTHGAAGVDGGDGGDGGIGRASGA